MLIEDEDAEKDASKTMARYWTDIPTIIQH